MSILQFVLSVLACLGIEIAFVLLMTGFFYLLSELDKKRTKVSF